jgi:hypothetical protein
MSRWTSPDPWECAACGATGLGGRPAYNAHIDAVHAVRRSTDRDALLAALQAALTPDGTPSSASALGIPAEQIRDWAKKHDLPYSTTGRLDVRLIAAYCAYHRSLTCTPD